MVRLLAVLCLLPLCASAQQSAPAPSSPPVAAPDYKTLYGAANDAAAKWKAQAEALQAELERIHAQAQQETARNEAVGQRAQANTGAYAPPRHGPVAQEGVVGGNPNGVRTASVPLNVAADIRAKAEARWPDDYRMQKYEIDAQEKAYRELHGG